MRERCLSCVLFVKLPYMKKKKRPKFKCKAKTKVIRLVSSEGLRAPR